MHRNEKTGMKYFNVTVDVKPDNEEEAESLLFSVGADSVSVYPAEHGVELKAIFSSMRLSEAETNPLFAALNPVIEELPDKEWVDEWIKYYEPVYLDEEFIIVPDDFTGELKDNGAIRLKINPRGAFGSGTHPTTLMCLKQIKKAVTEMKKSGSSVSAVDIGTGSGILAIAAEKCGADVVDAYDIDQKSVDKTLENIALNDCKRINAYLLSIEESEVIKQYSIVIANLQSCIIESNIDTIVNSSQKNGVIILSGIYLKWKDDIIKILTERNCIIKKTEMLDEWVCIVAEKC
jgi:ribosomal protein L11 methyltransferase